MEEDDGIPTAVVIDNGSGTLKAGFAGDDAPRCVIPAVIGRSRYDFAMSDSDDESCSQERATFVGDFAQRARDFLNMEYPIQRGIVNNWDSAEKLWDFCFKDLKVDDPSEHPLIMSEPVLNPISCKERMLECVFETFNVHSFFMLGATSMSLTACGRGLGLVIDIGDGLTQLTPIHYCHIPRYAIRRQDFGGNDVTAYLARLLNKRGYTFSTQAEMEDVREIKESSSFVARDFDSEMQSTNLVKEASFVLDDETTIKAGKELSLCSECIFNPKLANPNSDLKGIQELLEECLDCLEADIRMDFYTNVILSGAVTLTPGFEERMTQILDNVVKSRTKGASRVVTRVVAPIERKYSVFIGGSIEGSLSFKEHWVTKEEYSEYGPSVVRSR